jgi:hypothetical protein
VFEVGSFEVPESDTDGFFVPEQAGGTFALVGAGNSCARLEVTGCGHFDLTGFRSVGLAGELVPRDAVDDSVVLLEECRLCLLWRWGIAVLLIFN